MLQGPSGEAEETGRQWEGCSGQGAPVLLGDSVLWTRNRIFQLSSFQSHPYCPDEVTEIQRGGVIC